MACNRNSPASPRSGPKLQQQSWEESGTPPINIFDAPSTSPPRSSSSSGRSHYEQKSPKSPRNPHGYFAENRSPSSSRKFNYCDQRSPKGYNDVFEDPPPRSPKIVYSNGDCDDSYNQNGSGSGGSYYSHSSPRRSPNSPGKFVFDAVNPRTEQKAYKKFEYYEPVTPDDEIFKFCSPPKTSKFCGSLNSPSSKVKVSRNLDYHKKHEDIGLTETFPVREKRHSVVTESTLSGESATSTTTTTAPCKSTSSNTSCGEGGCGVGNAGGSGGGPGSGSGGPPNSRSGCRRRHAINITSNPGYQALHTSHSTLDRTCSDSIVSLRYRKSTSDLTDLTATATESNSPVVSASTHKRRGSSKGGLAYLASRRNSRDSMKSAASNASLFSNEDIGPLAFQSSARGRTRRTSNFLELPIPDHIRPRVCSLPERPYNPRISDDLYRLRTFSISKGTVVNCGDSIISRRSRSNTSVNSTNSRASERSPFDGSCCGGGYATVDSLQPSPDDSEEPPPPPRYRVVMMGDAGVGKTALVSQFMTSEYMHTYDASLDDEFGEKTVSILLDGEESEMIFIDHPSTEMSVENSLSTYEPHGCVVVYSVVQRSSFRQAEEIINYLWRENVARDKAVILVGNKADLARSRVIPTSEGKSLAQSRDAKFIETSSGIQHNVDELLVGILKQIRLKETRTKKVAAQTALKIRNSRTHMSLHLAKEILQKICLSDITKSKSCENLHVL